MGIWRKKTGGGLPESHFHFLLFLTWETPPKKVLKCKINHIFFKKKHVIPKQGGRGGSSTWEKFPHFPVFFGDVPYLFSLSFYQIRKLRIFIFILISRPVCQFIQTFTIFATACYCLSKRISMEIKIGNRPKAAFPMISSSSSSFSV